MGPRTVLLFAALLCTSACKQPQRTGPAKRTSSATAEPLAEALPPLAGEQVEIPPSTFQAGTRPGQFGRDPELEPRLTQVTLGGFRIDRLPFPNDPAQPALVDVPRTVAEQRCAEQGKRLCTELEWELACKGPESTPFASGAEWSQQCAGSDARCPSALGVMGLGRMREWTASSEHAQSELPVVRGAPPSAPADLHRCAHRSTLSADEHAADLGFRCCKGAPNAAQVQVPQLGTAFVPFELPLEKLSAALATDPHTKGLSKLTYFKDPEASRTVLARGDGDTQGFSFTVKPLLWNPDIGTQIVVASGAADAERAFVVALLVVGDDEYRVASSMILRDEPGPVALAYSNDIRPRMHFSSCWGCPGENGKILYRKPDAVVITQP